MAYCAKCGSQLNESDKACGNCGEPVPGANRAPETTSSNDMWMGILSYLGLLALIPYLVKDQSAFVRSHAVRGIVGLASFAFSLIGIINVANKEDKDLPVIGNIRLIKG